MQCVKIAGAKKLKVEEMEMPERSRSDVIIKVNSCGICGSDIHSFVSGEPKGLVMGHEFAGEVLDPGDRNDLKIGQRVTGLPISPCLKCDACKSGNPQYCRSTWTDALGLSLTRPGAYSEYIKCRGDMVRKIPDSISDDEAAMVEPSAVSLHAINLADIKVGNSVLIIGGGIIGLMASEFAKLNGASNVTLLETNEKRGKKSLKFGKVDKFYDAKDPKVIPSLVQKNGGFDVVIECCGSSAAVSEAIMAVKPGGTIVLVGVSMEPISIPSVMSVMGEVKMHGAIAYTEKEFDTCIDLISQKIINVVKYIDDKVPLSEAQHSFERLTSGTDDAIKIILKPQKTISE